VGPQVRSRGTLGGVDEAGAVAVADAHLRPAQEGRRVGIDRAAADGVATLERVLRLVADRDGRGAGLGGMCAAGTRPIARKAPVAESPC
jgi:hypothetical protein